MLYLQVRVSNETEMWQAGFLIALFCFSNFKMMIVAFQTLKCI